MSPAKKKSGARRARPGPRKVARKAARKAAGNAARKRAAKRAARRSGVGGAKKSARGTPKRITLKSGRAARKRARAARVRPDLRLVKPRAKRAAGRTARRRATPKPVPEAFAGAKAGASARDLLLFELERARVSVHAALQGLSEAAANRPIAPGRWSPRQIVLHLARWDREVAGWVEPVYSQNRSVRFDWSGLAAHNDRWTAEMSSIGWEEAKRFLQAARAELLDALESIPEEPSAVWTREHALGKMIWILPGHDRHHADQIKGARSESAP